MIEFLTSLFTGIVGGLGQLLPESPFADMTIDQTFVEYLGWLNWWCPIGEMLTVFSTVLAMLLVVKVAVWGMNNAEKLAELFAE